MTIATDHGLWEAGVSISKNGVDEHTWLSAVSIEPDWLGTNYLPSYSYYD